jgi:type IV secretory pathway TrbD component
MPGSASEHQAGNHVYQSLQRPHLLWGGERELSLINAMVVTLLATFGLVGFNLRLLAYAAFFAFPAQWLIRMLSKEDPDYFKNYFRARKHPPIREAN